MRRRAVALEFVPGALKAPAFCRARRAACALPAAHGGRRGGAGARAPPRFGTASLLWERCAQRLKGRPLAEPLAASSAREAPLVSVLLPPLGGRAACGGGEGEGRAPCAGALRQACQAKLEVLPASNASVRMRSELAHAERPWRTRRQLAGAVALGCRRRSGQEDGPKRVARGRPAVCGFLRRGAAPWPGPPARRLPGLDPGAFAAPPSARRPWPRPERRTWRRRRSGKGVPRFSRRRRAAGRRRPASRWPRDGPAMAMALPEMLDGQAGRAGRLAAGPLRSRALGRRRRGLHSAGPGGVPGRRRAG